MRLFALAVVLALAVLLPFVFWGDTFTQWLGDDAAVQSLRGFGAWGWTIAIILLVGDLFLPIPATPIMSAIGYLYGAWVGGLISAGGSFLSGMLAYVLCRNFGRRAAVWLAGEMELARSEVWFRERGAWLVALSRWLPILPEVVACLAGLARMPPGRFTMALACGSVPMGFAYAGIGAAGKEYPNLALALSAIVPALLWGAVQWIWRRKDRRQPAPPERSP